MLRDQSRSSEILVPWPTELHARGAYATRIYAFAARGRDYTYLRENVIPGNEQSGESGSAEDRYRVRDCRLQKWTGSLFPFSSFVRGHPLNLLIPTSYQTCCCVYAGYAVRRSSSVAVTWRDKQPVCILKVHPSDCTRDVRAFYRV